MCSCTNTHSRKMWWRKRKTQPSRARDCGMYVHCTTNMRIQHEIMLLESDLKCMLEREGKSYTDGSETDKWHVICLNVVIIHVRCAECEYLVHYLLIRQHHICLQRRQCRCVGLSTIGRRVGWVDVCDVDRATTFHSHRVDCFIYFVCYFFLSLSCSLFLPPPLPPLPIHFDFLLEFNVKRVISVDDYFIDQLNLEYIV